MSKGQIETLSDGKRVRWEVAKPSLWGGWREQNSEPGLWRALVRRAEDGRIRYVFWTPTRGWTHEAFFPQGTTIEQAMEATLNMLRIGAYGPGGGPE